MNRTNTYFASCPRELEDLLTQEIKKVSINDVETYYGGVEFKSSAEKALRLLVRTRIASKVYQKLFSTRIQHEKDLYDFSLKQRWEKIFHLRQTFKVKTLIDHSIKGDFKNTMSPSLILKDGIVDHFRKIRDRRPNIDTKKPNVTILVYIKGKDQEGGYNVDISLDLCGVPLSSRGYRKPGHEAPLRENLAAAIIKRMDWDPSQDIFVDAMCGSGTLLIEAAMIKGHIPPTFLKIQNYVEQQISPWDFLDHLWFKNDEHLASKFQLQMVKLNKQIKERIINLDFNQFYGYDIDGKSLDLARRHSAISQLKGIITLKHCDSTKVRAPAPAPGVVIANLPYGERLGKDHKNLEKLYHQFGENLKRNFKGYKAYVFTGNAEMRKKISLQTSKRIAFYNGPLECRLLEYKLF